MIVECIDRSDSAEEKSMEFDALDALFLGDFGCLSLLLVELSGQ